MFQARREGQWNLGWGGTEEVGRRDAGRLGRTPMNPSLHAVVSSHWILG